MNMQPFGLIGEHLSHSWSPQIHEILGSYPYDLYELGREELSHVLREGAWRGLNVTIPYKVDVCALADALSERVRAIGAANTLVKQADGTIYAENTDAMGFLWLLESFCNTHYSVSAHELLQNKTVIILGHGGASLAVEYVLEDLGARVHFATRSEAPYLCDIERTIPDATLIVNCTPVGMYPACPKSPLTEAQLAAFTQLKGVLDIIYNPEVTEITYLADKHGIPAQTGLDMLVAQAFYASQLFQDKMLDESKIGEIVSLIKRQTQNIVLIGMPGAGKTSCARELGELLKRETFDADTMFEETYGMSTAQCIQELGEDEFRQRETAVLGALCKQSGTVIATGGGVVVRDENYLLLHQNSRIILLDRALDELSLEGRPISQSKGLQRLAEERMPRYRAWADAIVPCSGSAGGDARIISQLLGYSG